MSVSTQPMSHGTQVEQARAVADVYTAAELASRFPRNVQACIEEMHDACSRVELARVAEYALPRSGTKDVIGPSVHLARELALIWRHINHGIVEITRGDGQSELLAYAWDVQRNVRSARTVIVPHTRDKNTYSAPYGTQGRRKTGTVAEPIDTQQDITNQNNSVAARQLRENIFSVLPQWFATMAVQACRDTVGKSKAVERADRRPQVTGSAPLRGQAAAEAEHPWAAEGVTHRQLETWLDLPADQWDAAALHRLDVLWWSLSNGEITLKQAFPPPSVPTVEDLQPARQAPSVADLQPSAEPSDAELEPTDDERAQFGGGQDA